MWSQPNQPPRRLRCRRSSCLPEMRPGHYSHQGGPYTDHGEGYERQILTCHDAAMRSSAASIRMVSLTKMFGPNTLHAWLCLESARVHEVPQIRHDRHWRLQCTGLV
jgi:hypothetical protein